jgi:hypothetical protein
MKKIIAGLFIISFICLSVASQAVSKELYRGCFNIDYSRDYRNPRISYVELYNPLGMRIVYSIPNSYGGVDKEDRYYQYTRFTLKNCIVKCKKADLIEDKILLANIRTHIYNYGILRARDYGTKRLNCIADDYITNSYIINTKWDFSLNNISLPSHMKRLKLMRNHSITTRAKIYVTITSTD